METGMEADVFWNEDWIRQDPHKGCYLEKTPFLEKEDLEKSVCRHRLRIQKMSLLETD